MANDSPGWFQTYGLPLNGSTKLGAASSDHAFSFDTMIREFDYPFNFNSTTSPQNVSLISFSSRRLSIDLMRHKLASSFDHGLLSVKICFKVPSLGTLSYKEMKSCFWGP